MSRRGPEGPSLAFQPPRPSEPVAVRGGALGIEARRPQLEAGVDIEIGLVGDVVCVVREELVHHLDVDRVVSATAAIRWSGPPFRDGQRLAVRFGEGEPAAHPTWPPSLFLHESAFQAARSG